MIRALRQSECLIRDGYSTDGTTNRCFAADGCAAHLSAGAGGSHWAMNRLIGWRDFEVLAPEVDVLLRAGFCLNQDALYKWAAVMHAIRFLLDCSSPAPPKEGLHCQELLLDFGPNAPTEHSGLGLGGKLRSVDIGAGSAPLQHWAAQFGPVTAIDINFQSSWFPIDNQGFFVGADKLVLPPRFANLSQVEGDLLAVLGAIPDASLDLVYDACSLIHMSHPLLGAPVPVRLCLHARVRSISLNLLCEAGFLTFPRRRTAFAPRWHKSTACFVLAVSSLLSLTWRIPLHQRPASLPK